MNEERKLNKSLAIKYGVPEKEVEVICRSPFKFVASVMKLKTLQSIRLPYWGLYSCKKKRVQALQDRNLL